MPLHRPRDFNDGDLYFGIESRRREARQRKSVRDFGALVQRKIEEQGLTLDDAGRAFGFKSVAEQVQSVIDGKVELTFSGTRRFAAALGLSAEDLRPFLADDSDAED